MKTIPDNNNWLEKFQLVKVTRRMEDDIKRHRCEMNSASGVETDWDSALVDWVMHSAHTYAKEHRNVPQL
ncbi:MAG: hypothetical protein PHP44_01950 [Kiritimatiellae bacterium]|nr:hypothetical protein [Kiritimatiellia bacterium]MDD4734850.1 hypothetical protein [Kiritimatiellia bacterium]